MFVLWYLLYYQNSHNLSQSVCKWLSTKTCVNIHFIIPSDWGIKWNLVITKSQHSRDHHHHHHVVPLARISLTLSRHFSLSFIASSRSSGLHPVSSHSCWMYVIAGRPAFARPYVGVHRSTSLMSSSLIAGDRDLSLSLTYQLIFWILFFQKRYILHCKTKFHQLMAECLIFK